MATITVYTRPACGPCMATKRTLEKAGVTFDEVKTEEHPEAVTMLQELGYRQAPVIVIGDRHWGGFRPDLLAEAISELSLAQAA